MRKLLLILLFATAVYADKPETVFSTYRPKPGKEAETLRIVREAWSLYTKLNLVTGDHQFYRAETEGGSVYYVHIFTWRDENIPDHVPPEIQAVWKEMNANCRVDFAVITPLSEESSPRAGGPSR